MKSEFCQWLTDLSEIAEKEDVLIEAKYYDALNYMFKIKHPIETALFLYKQFAKRIKAIEKNETKRI